MNIDEYARSKEIGKANPDNHDTFFNYVGYHDGRLLAAGETYVEAGVDILAKAIHTYAVSKGWWPEDEKSRNFGEVIALIHSEATEALEAYRDGDEFDKITYEFGITKSDEFTLNTPEGTVYGKPVGIASEMADIIIRVLDACEAFEIPITQALIEKHRYNLTRSYRHGGKKA